MPSASPVLTFNLQNNPNIGRGSIRKCVPPRCYSVFSKWKATTWGMVYNPFTLLLDGDWKKDKPKALSHRYLDLGLSLPDN